MELEYESSSPKVLLRISPVEIEDEADYKCEITYWEVREDCETVHIIKLKTLGKQKLYKSCACKEYSGRLRNGNYWTMLTWLHGKSWAIYGRFVGRYINQGCRKDGPLIF